MSQELDDGFEPGDPDHGDRDDLGPELELIAQLLASGQSHAQAGLAVGRSAKFVQRALGDTLMFKDRVRAIQEERAAQAAAGLSSLLPDAVEATRRALVSQSTPDELRAAALVFKEFHGYRSESAAAQRIADLQAQIDDLRVLLSVPADDTAGGPR